MIRYIKDQINWDSGSDEALKQELIRDEIAEVLNFNESYTKLLEIRQIDSESSKMLGRTEIMKIKTDIETLYKELKNIIKDDFLLSTVSLLLYYIILLFLILFLLVVAVEVVQAASN